MKLSPVRVFLVIVFVFIGCFGIAFAEEIDPKLARAPIAAPGTGETTPRFVKTPLPIVEQARLRKI